MDREALLKMDPNILVSMINMKLRDFYSNIDLINKIEVISFYCFYFIAKIEGGAIINEKKS